MGQEWDVRAYLATQETGLIMVAEGAHCRRVPEIGSLTGYPLHCEGGAWRLVPATNVQYLDFRIGLERRRRVN